MGRHYFRRGTCYNGSGVYAIRHKVTLKPYVGSAARNMRKRWSNHRAALNRGTHPNVHLQRAWDKYGEDAFEFLLVEKCSPEDCVAREQYWIDKLDAFRSGYNRSPIAGSRLGAKLSDESKAKIRAAKVGTRMSAEAREKMSASRKGKKMSEAHRANYIAGHWSKGPNAEEIAAKISAGNKGHGCSEETRAKISATKLGKKMGPEFSAKMSAIVKGRKHTPEARAKISATKRANALARKMAKLAQS